MKVLELFCGRGGWSKPWIESGHDVTGIDINDLGYPGKFIKADLLDYEPEPIYDVILASPPCSEFTQMKFHNGNADERQGLDLVYRTFYLIGKLKPKYFLIENVKGLAKFIDKPDQKIRYGKSNKWAYLWTNIPQLGFFSFDFADYGRDKLYHGTISGWEAYKTGIRAEIPKALATHVFKSIQ